MTEIAKHIRIFNASPNDDFVSKRITAINAIETAIKKKINANDIFEFANGLLSALENPENPNDEISRVSVTALKKSSTSFVADDESLQLLTCTLLATLQYLEKAKAFTQKPSPEFILAVALWNGLSFQQPIADKERLESLRQELLAIATKIATDVSTTSRQRKDTKPRIPLLAPADLANIESSYGKLIDAMRINSILDREELDVLWWALGGWSSICGIQISKLNPVQMCLVASVEIGKLLRRFPAQAHTHLACRGTAQNDEFTASEIIEQMGDQLAKITSIVTTKEAITYQKIFPVSNLLINPAESTGNDVNRTLYEWASRLLVEFSMNNISKFIE